MEPEMVDIGSAVVSAVMAVLSLVAMVFAWVRANVSKRAQGAAEEAERRAVAQVQAAQEQAVAARESARAAGEQVERLGRLVAAQEAQGRDLGRIAERVSPVGLTIEHVGGERYALRNNGDEACEVVGVVNRGELAGLMLPLPVRVESRRAIDFLIAETLASMAPPADMVLQVTGVSGPVVVPIPRG